MNEDQLLDFQSAYDDLKITAHFKSGYVENIPCSDLLGTRYFIVRTYLGLSDNTKVECNPVSIKAKKVIVEVSKCNCTYSEYLAAEASGTYGDLNTVPICNAEYNLNFGFDASAVNFDLLEGEKAEINYYSGGVQINLTDEFGQMDKNADMGALVSLLSECKTANINVNLEMSLCDSITSLDYVAVGVSKTDVFADLSNLVEINLPQTITTIPNGCFKSCGLKSVSIPYGVTTIGDYAFANCTAVTEVSIPSTVNLISNSSFEGITKVETLTVSSDNTYYEATDENAILDKDRIQVIDLKAGVKAANQSSLKLYYDEDLQNYTTPPSTFDKRLNLDLSSFVITERPGFTPMGWYYFSDDETVKVDGNTVNPETYNTYINDGVLSLKAKYAVDVQHYTSIVWSNYTNAKYPNGLTLNLYSDTAITGDDIGFFCTAVSSFKEECTGLKININMSECSDIIFPAAAFEGKTNIVSIILPPTQTSIPMQFLKETGIKKLVLPDTVGIIDQDAFAWCNDLEYVDIGEAAITNTGGRYSDCFRYTFNIKEFAVSENNRHHILSEDKQMVLSKDGLQVYVDGFQKAGTTRKIPEGVRVIGGYMYYGTGVSEVIFPESLMAIDNDVFTLSSDLTVNIPARVYQICRNVLSGIIGSNVNVTFDGIDGWYKTDTVNQTPRPSELSNGDLLNSSSDPFTYYCRNFISKNKVGNGTDDGLATEIRDNANSLYNIIFSFMHSSWDTTSSSLSDSDFTALKTAFESFTSSCTFVLDLYDATNTELVDWWLDGIDNVHFSTIILPHGLETINDYALQECKIDKIKIPASVKSIGENALYSSYPRTIEIENLNGWYDQHGDPVAADEVMDRISWGDAIHKN